MFYYVFDPCSVYILGFATTSTSVSPFSFGFRNCWSWRMLVLFVHVFVYQGWSFQEWFIMFGTVWY